MSYPHPLAYLADVASRGPRCALHGDDTSSGRCGSCEQLAYDQAQAHLEQQAEEAAARAEWDASRAEEHWYEQNDGWVQ